MHCKNNCIGDYALMLYTLLAQDTYTVGFSTLRFFCAGVPSVPWVALITFSIFVTCTFPAGPPLPLAINDLKDK
jgi:hypothetical protein